MARGDNLFRQWKLIKVLQAHYRYGVDTETIAARLECTKRTVQRDLGVLQDVFPIRYEQRDRGKRFWRLDHEMVESAQLQLSMTEMLSLFLSQQLLLPLAGTQFGDGLQTALQKIRVILPAKALRYFERLDESFFIKRWASHDYSPQDRDIRILNEAILSGHALKVTYRSAGKDRDTSAEFHPYGIVLLHTSLYCVGRFACHDEIRTLKISRIQKLVPLKKTFERPENFSLADYFHGAFGVFQTGKKVFIRATFSDWAATSVREMQWHPSQQIVSDTAQALVATFELASTIEFKRWILGFGRHARVVAPRDLAEEIREEHRVASQRQ